MTSFGRSILVLLSFVLCDASLAGTMLFDDRIDSQQKTEIRYDVPDGCVITGLGFRAAYDNITTMHCRYHRVTSNGTLADPNEAHLGSEPNHACEAKVLLPDGWVAVGLGAAGEPEWDVTLLRLWARPLRPDGTLGETKAFSDGFKPDREPERDVVLTDPGRVLTGAGLRFASNDIGGIYARSKRILNLTEKDRQKLANFTTRAWVVSGLLYSRLSSLTDDLTSYGVRRLDIAIPRMLSAFPAADNLESNVWVRTADFTSIKQILADGPNFDGIVVDLSRLAPASRDPNTLLGLHKACRAENLRMSLRLDHRTYPLSARNLELVRAMPRDVGLIVPLYEPRIFRRTEVALDFAPFGPRESIVEFDLVRHSMGSSRIPDVRIDELPALIVEAALAGAKGFIVQVSILHRELLDGVNSISLEALHRLADDPFQPTDPLWGELCAAKYGPAVVPATSALKRTAAINDLVYRTFDYPIFWYSGTMHPLPNIDDRIRYFAQTATSPQRKTLLQKLGDPTDNTIRQASQEKQTALWLVAQSVTDANLALETNPSPQTRALADGLQRLHFVVLFWQNATRAYLLTKLYATDGAPITHANVTDALKALARTSDNMMPTNGLGVLRLGDTAFIRTIQSSLEYSQKHALLPAALRKIAALADDSSGDAAAELCLILTTQKFVPHIDKHNRTIAKIASSLQALGGTSGDIAVMRHGDGRWLIEKVAGQWSYQIGNNRPCLYLDFPAGPLDTPADYRLSFEYFDKGNWKLHFNYDSVYPPEQKREYHPAEPLQLTNTKTWKKHSFGLTNCRFGSGQNDGADMRFVTGNGANIRNIHIRPK